MSRAEVKFRPGEAVVTYDPALVGVQAMVDAVNRLGFRAVAKRPEPGR